MLNALTSAKNNTTMANTSYKSVSFLEFVEDFDTVAVRTRAANGRSFKSIACMDEKGAVSDYIAFPKGNGSSGKSLEDLLGDDFPFEGNNATIGGFIEKHADEFTVLIGSDANGDPYNTLVRSFPLEDDYAMKLGK
jgi:hypothetical protein